MKSNLLYSKTRIALGAGGKPSTWFPPEGLVELLTLPAPSVSHFSLSTFLLYHFLLYLLAAYRVLSLRAARPTPVAFRPGLSEARPIFADRCEG